MLLPHSIATCLRERAAADFSLAGYEVKGNPPTGDLREAINVLNGLCAPAPPIEIAGFLATLYALTKQRAEDQITLDLAIQAFAARLEKFPGIAVKQALEAWPDKSKWFPSWQELREEIEAVDKATMMRSAVYAALDAPSNKPTPKETQNSEINQIPKSEFIKMLNENPARFLKQE